MIQSHYNENDIMLVNMRKSVAYDINSDKAITPKCGLEMLTHRHSAGPRDRALTSFICADKSSSCHFTELDAIM